MSDRPLQYARANDGAHIAYHLRDAGPGFPRLVFLHSLGMDHTLWAPVGALIAPHASVLNLDLRGHGRSDKSLPYSAERLARDLHDVLDHVGWSQVTVVGASLGGCVALQFAADYPHRVHALGLVDTTAWYGPNAVQHWGARARRAREEGLSSMVPFQETRWFSDAFRVARPDVVERCVNTFLDNDVMAFAAMAEMLGQFDGRHLLPRIGMPTSIVVGEEDYATPVAMSEAVLRGIRGARLTVIPVARHLPQIERPDAVAAVLIRLLATAFTANAHHHPNPWSLPATGPEARPGEVFP